MKIGDRVRPSGYATQAARDYWNQCGREPAKSRAREQLDKLIAQRGTITEIIAQGYVVQWDDGSVSRCLSNRIELA